MEPEEVTLYLAVVLFLGVAAQWIAWRVRLPAILLLLVFGFAAGFWNRPSDVLGDGVVFPLVSLSVAIIMFEGGLSLRLPELRETGVVVLRLVTVGVLVTWVAAATAAVWILGFSVQMAALLGAILVVSGPTVILPLLRHVRPIGRIGSLVKWEGIVNDPIGAVLAVLVFQYIMAGGKGAGATILTLGATFAVGALAAVAASGILVVALKRFWIPDYLHVSAALAIVVVAFTLPNLWWPESGLVAVTLMGVIVANQKEVVVRHVVEFKENLRVLLIALLFIMLASRVRLEDLRDIGWSGPAFLAVLLLIIRPAMVWLSTIGSDLNWRERVFLSWLHPRGIVAAAVSSLFALELLGGHAEALPPAVANDAARLVPITFLAIAGTVAIYGLTISPLARWLGLSRRDPQGILFAGAAPWVREIAEVVKEEGFEVLLVDTNYQNIAAARMAGLRTAYASVLSEHVHEEQDLTALGRLLAMTPNDEVNALATIQYLDHFDSAGVYQLPPRQTESGSSRQTPVSEFRPGRHLFSPEATYAWLSQRFSAGAELRRTPLTEDFTYEDFRVKYGESALPLFIVTESRKLRICTAGEKLDPEPGQKIIALVDGE